MGGGGSGGAGRRGRRSSAEMRAGYMTRQRTRAAGLRLSTSGSGTPARGAGGQTRLR